MSKGSIGGSDLLKGLTRKLPPGDSGARPGSGRVDSDPTRGSVAKSHSIGGREA